MVSFYRENHLTYEELGRYFGVSRQAICKMLKEAHWKAAKEGEELLRELFNLLRFTSPGKIDRVYNKK
ncbi:MAG: hypothetical protein J7L62_00205 [Candidatus Aminicenantes bacterium]|nr:hypothetical protein [Candidatus Aminicenantes bacterium]